MLLHLISMEDGIDEEVKVGVRVGVLIAVWVSGDLVRQQRGEQRVVTVDMKGVGVKGMCLLQVLSRRRAGGKIEVGATQDGSERGAKVRSMVLVRYRIVDEMHGKGINSRLN